MYGYLPYYLTESEFNNIPIVSEGKIFQERFTPLGFRTPFVANSIN